MILKQPPKIRIFTSLKVKYVFFRWYRMKISVVAPMYNEEAVIAAYLSRTLDVLEKNYTNYELILIDDGSTDGTVAQCLPFVRSHKGIRLLTFSRNYGHEIASTAGFDHASGDVVILMDTDLQHPPELIPAMIQKYLQGYDIVCGSRTNNTHPSFIKNITSRFFYYIAQKMTGFKLNPSNGNFRLLSKQVINSLKNMKENDRHLVMMFEYVGFRQTNIEYECAPRLQGETKYGILKLVNLALDSIIGFSRRPLRLMSVFSVLISGIMMLYAGFILVEKLFLRQTLADGMASVIFLISGLFSILFLFLAIISEYISRILVESKNRPLYNIRQEITNESTHEVS